MTRWSYLMVYTLVRVIVTDENGNVLYTEQVPEIGEEPNYKAALEALYLMLMPKKESFLVTKSIKKRRVCF